MRQFVDVLVNCLLSPGAQSASVIGWSAPVLSFGDISRASIASIGLNPSNLEFVDLSGAELQGLDRRFHTLRSLGLGTWMEANHSHLDQVIESCRDYFQRNPYDRWFRVLDRVVNPMGVSYYGASPSVCHLDLIPYATAQKWSFVPRAERGALLSSFGRILGTVLRQSSIQLLILNGQSVVQHFQLISRSLNSEERRDWSLSRKGTASVPGFSFKGVVTSVGGISLERPVLVLGFNHNLQSSFGVTRFVTERVGEWLRAEAQEVL
jgi:hypothetical protein